MLTVTDDRVTTAVCVASVTVALCVLLVRSALQYVVRQLSARGVCARVAAAAAASSGRSTAARLVEYALLTSLALTRALASAHGGVVALSLCLAACTAAAVSWSWRSAWRLTVCVFVLYTLLLPVLLSRYVVYDYTSTAMTATVHQAEWASAHRGQRVHLPTYTYTRAAAAAAWLQDGDDNSSRGDDRGSATTALRGAACATDRVFVFHDHVHITWQPPAHNTHCRDVCNATAATTTLVAQTSACALYVWSVGAATQLRGTPRLLEPQQASSPPRRRTHERGDGDGRREEHNAADTAQRWSASAHSSHLCLLGPGAVVRDATLLCAAPPQICLVAQRDAVFVNVTIVVLPRQLQSSNNNSSSSSTVHIDEPVDCNTFAQRVCAQTSAAGQTCVVRCIEDDEVVAGAATRQASSLPLLLDRCVVTTHATTADDDAAASVALAYVTRRFAARMPPLRALSWWAVPRVLALRQRSDVLAARLQPYAHDIARCGGRVGRALYTRVRVGGVTSVTAVRHFAAGVWCAATATAATASSLVSTRSSKHAHTTRHALWLACVSRGDADSYRAGVYAAAMACAAAQHTALMLWSAARQLRRLTPPLLRRGGVAVASALQHTTHTLLFSATSRHVWWLLWRLVCVLRRASVLMVARVCGVLHVVVRHGMLRVWRMYAATSLSTQLVVVALQSVVLVMALRREVRDALWAAASSTPTRTSATTTTPTTSTATTTTTAAKATATTTRRRRSGRDVASDTATVHDAADDEQQQQQQQRGRRGQGRERALSSPSLRWWRRWWPRRVRGGGGGSGVPMVVWPAALSSLALSVHCLWSRSSAARLCRAAHSLRTHRSLSVHYLVVHSVLLLSLVGLSVLPGATLLYRGVLLLVLPWWSSHALLAFVARPPRHTPSTWQVAVLCVCKMALATLLEHTVGTLLRSVLRDVLLSLLVFVLCYALLYASSHTQPPP